MLHLFFKKGDFVLAYRYAEEVIRLYPDVAYHYRNMAAACQLNGDSLGVKKYRDQYLFTGGQP